METNLNNNILIKKMFQKQLLVTISTIFLLVFILIGSSYALLNAKTETGLTDVVVQSGNLLATISSNSEIIQMNYTTLGVSDEVGLSYDPYTFTVSNDGENKILYYEIRIVDKEYEISTLPHKSLNYALSVNGSDYTNPQNLGDNRSYIYVGGSLDVGESDTFNLKLWVNEEYGKYANNKILKASIELTLYSDVPTRNYIIYDSQGGSYIPKTNIVSKRISMQTPLKSGYSFIGWSTTPTGNVEYESNEIYNGNNGMTLYAKYEEATITYNLNGGTGDIPSNKASEGITTIVPTKEGYKFKGWSTTANGEVVYQSGDTYSGNSITLYAVWKQAEYLYDKLESTLVSNLKELDFNETKIVYGNEVDSNYVWYSGKLWRVVSLNNDRTVKLVSKNNMTTISWGDSDYSKSQIRTWLNNDFLLTLYKSDQFIKSSNWYYSSAQMIDDIPSSDVFVNEKVGMLNLYEVVSIKGGTRFDAGWIDNNYSFTTLTWNVFDPFVFSVTSDNNILEDTSIREIVGIRPSINLNENVIISDGNGTMSNPFLLEGDISAGVNNEYLYTRISGEYIKYDDTIYRIVGTETINNQILTKVTMADYSKNKNTIGIQPFGNTNDDVGAMFSVSKGIGLYLNNWYDTISASYKDMIATEGDGVLWYQGPTNGIEYDYTKSKLGIGISSKIGLPYYGEIFSNQFGEGYENSTEFWLLTKYNATTIWNISTSNDNFAYMDSNIDEMLGVRPSFYLKSTVKIGDADGDGKVGTGLPNDPYEIVMD